MVQFFQKFASVTGFSGSSTRIWVLHCMPPYSKFWWTRYRTRNYTFFTKSICWMPLWGHHSRQYFALKVMSTSSRFPHPSQANLNSKRVILRFMELARYVWDTLEPLFIALASVSVWFEPREDGDYTNSTQAMNAICLNMSDSTHTQVPSIVHRQYRVQALDGDKRRDVQYSRLHYAMCLQF